MPIDAKPTTRHTHVLLEEPRTVGLPKPDGDTHADVVGHECLTCDRFFFMDESFAVCESRGHNIQPVFRRSRAR